MSDTTPEQESPLSPARDPRTYYEIMADATLSCAARVAFAAMYPLLEMHRSYAFSLDEIGTIVGFAERATTKLFAELEGAGVVVSRIGGRGKPKIFSLGPAVRGGSVAVTSPPRSGGNNNAIRGEIAKHDRATQTRFNLAAPQKSSALSSSRTIAPGKLESNTKRDRVLANLKAKATTTTAPFNSSSSSLFDKIRREVPTFARRSFDAALRDFGAARIEKQLAELPRRLEYYASIGRPVASVDGFFLRSIAGDWNPAAAPVKRPPKVKQWQLDHADRELQSAKYARVTPTSEIESYRAGDSERALEAEQFYLTLPPDVRADIDARTEKAMKTVPAAASADAAANFRKQFRIGAILKLRTLGG